MHACILGCLFIIVSFSSPEGADYQLVDLQLEFLPGEERVEFNITIVDDKVMEDPEEESFLLALSILDDITSKGVQLGPNARATVTITDNDGELAETCTMQSLYDTVPISLIFHRNMDPYIKLLYCTYLVLNK